MKLANATNLNRKFGKPRDLLCAFPALKCRVPPNYRQSSLACINPWFNTDSNDGCFLI